MNCYGGKELAQSFRTVRKNTIQSAMDIPEDRYSYVAAPGIRSVAELLTHIAVSHIFQEEIHSKQRLSTLAGLNFPALFEAIAGEEKKPRSKAEIIELLRTKGEEFAAFLESASDAFLEERVLSGPVSRSRLEMLLSVKEHEMHHRGQLMLIERLLGITPHLTRDLEAWLAEMRASAKV